MTLTLHFYVLDKDLTQVKDPAALQDLKVGERISIKDGMLTKESGGSSAPEPSAPAHGPKY